MSAISKSDHIGRLGENLFDSLAIKAKLLVGKFDPDSFGKDRILEFETDEWTPNQTYDKRCAPLRCTIQIKTLLYDRTRASLRLSTAEKLAKDTQPTFICIIRINDKDDIVDMHLIHIMDRNLEKILKRLRKEHKHGTLDINHKEITFSINDGIRIPIKPIAFREALEGICGGDMNAYAKNKIFQLGNIGYTENRFSVNFGIESHSISEIVDGFLGLRKLDVRNFQTFEERFSIKIPHGSSAINEPIAGKLEITPTPIDSAIATIKSIQNKAEASIECDVITPGIPGLAVENFKLILRSKLIYFVIEHSKFSVFPTQETENDQEFTLESLVGALKIWRIFSEGPAHIKLQAPSGNTIFSGSTKAAGVFDVNITQIMSAAQKFGEIRRLACAPDCPIKLSAIADSADDISQVFEYFHNDKLLGSFNFSAAGKIPEMNNRLPFLFINILSVGNEIYAYALKLDMEGHQMENRTSLTSTAMTPLEIQKIPDCFEAYGAFREKMMRISGVTNSIFLGK